MLGRINNAPLPSTCQAESCKEPKGWLRNEKEDMITAIEYLYDFKKKLSELHPTVMEAIEHMLQRPRY